MSTSGGRELANLKYLNVLQMASAAHTVTGQTANLDTSITSQLLILANISAVSGTSPTLSFNLYQVGFDAVLYPIISSSVFSAAGQWIVSVGVGASSNFTVGNVMLINYVIGGTTPSFTFSLNVLGR